MFVLRCTRKLLQRGGLVAHDRPPSSTSLLGDWTANVVFLERRHLVLCVNNRTLLPVVLPMAPSKSLTERFTEAVAAMLTAIELDRSDVLAEISTMNECMVARTNDRRVLGIINNFELLLEACLAERSLEEAALWLSEVPCSPIGMRSPQDEARSHFLSKAGRVLH